MEVENEGLVAVIIWPTYELIVLICATHISGRFRGGRAGSGPPFGRWTNAVTVLLISKNGTVLWRVLNLDGSAIKHALQSTQNDCHQWLSDSSWVHQIRFWPGLQDPLGKLTACTGKQTIHTGIDRTAVLQKRAAQCTCSTSPKLALQTSVTTSHVTCWVWCYCS